MIKKVIRASLLLALSAALGYANIHYQTEYVTKSFYSVIAFTLSYSSFELLFGEIVAGRITESKTRFLFRRVTFMLHILVFLVLLLAIWVRNPQTLLVSYGLIAAGVAFALQEIFKNIAGGIILFVSRIYGIGDRIEINGKYGDVIDVGIMYTTLMELREWVSGDQPTGRITVIQNSQILSSPVNNYTKDHPFIWDEIGIPITYDSDWRKAEEIILRVVERETKEVTESAKRSISALADKYYLPQRSETPSVYMTLTDNWISLHVRYITEVRSRRPLRSRLSRLILEDFEKSDGVRVKIASSTMSVTIQNASSSKADGRGHAEDEAVRK